jgi:hypothetical protein
VLVDDGDVTVIGDEVDDAPTTGGGNEFVMVDGADDDLDDAGTVIGTNDDVIVLVVDVADDGISDEDRTDLDDDGDDFTVDKPAVDNNDDDNDDVNDVDGMAVGNFLSKAVAVSVAVAVEPIRC